MRMPWNKSRSTQLDLLDAVTIESNVQRPSADLTAASEANHAASPATPCGSAAPVTTSGQPLVVPVMYLYEDTNNPRTEVPETELAELAEDIRQRGILQPIVVHPADTAGRYRIHFGAKRLRAARRAGLQEVPVTVREAAADPYAQVAENQKRHGLTPLDLARFIRSRVEAGESNATIAKRLGMDQTTVAHHLGLLELSPELKDALKSGRCTSPRTLYELSKLHEEQPERARALIAGDSEITRAAVATMRAEHTPVATGTCPQRCASSLLAQASSACARLELTLTRIKQVEHEFVEAELAAVRQRVANLASRSA